MTARAKPLAQAGRPHAPRALRARVLSERERALLRWLLTQQLERLRQERAAARGRTT